MHSYQGTDEFRMLIRVLDKKINLFEKANASCCGITIGQCQVIWEIGLAGDMPLNELAGLLNLDNSTISRTINNLVVLGFVRRDANPEDRRYLKIGLTEKGVIFFKNMEEKIVMYYESVLESIPAHKKSQVLESLSLILNAVEQNSCCLLEGIESGKI